MTSNPCRKKQLGDLIEQALTTIGITSERVERWLGQPCGCEERKQRLNQLWGWATRIVQGKLDKAEEYLDNIIS